MDKRAVNILFNAYWSPTGWRSESDRLLSAEDFAYAKAQGMMFDPIALDHASAQDMLFGVLKKLSRTVVAGAFLASLSTRNLGWRSALGSYAVFQHLLPHLFADNNTSCPICDLYAKKELHDLNVLNFERLKWGGVRHYYLVYAAMDLTLFLEGSTPTPTSEDIALFRTLLSAIRSAPPKTTSATLHRFFPKELKSNKAERDVIIAILGYCGILATANHPGFSNIFVPHNQRYLPGRRFVDMPYPACWWTAESGINSAALDSYFGYYMGKTQFV